LTPGFHRRPDFRDENVFIEVVKPSLLGYSHVSAPKITSTVTFEETGGKTKLTMRMVFAPADERENVV
jgi:hypothetical protein